MNLDENVEVWRAELKSWKDMLSLWKKVIFEEPSQIYGQILRMSSIRDIIINRFLILSAIITYITTIFIAFGYAFIHFQPGPGDLSLLHVLLIIPVFAPFPVIMGIIFVGVVKGLRLLRTAVSKPLKPVYGDKQLCRKNHKDVRIEIYRWTFRGTYSYAIPIFLLYIIEEILGLRLNDIVGGMSLPAWLYGWLFGNTPLSILGPLISYISTFPSDAILLLITVIVIPGSFYAAAIRRYFVLKSNSVSNMDGDIKLVLGSLGLIFCTLYAVTFAYII